MSDYFMSDSKPLSFQWRLLSFVPGEYVDGSRYLPRLESSCSVDCYTPIGGVLSRLVCLVPHPPRVMPSVVKSILCPGVAGFEADCTPVSGVAHVLDTNTGAMTSEKAVYQLEYLEIQYSLTQYRGME